METNKYIFKLNLSNEKEYDYNYLSYIENKLHISLTEKEALYLLKWIVYRCQSILIPQNSTLEYMCEDAAKLVSALLESLGLTHYTFNINSVIQSSFTIHELTIVEIIINGEITKYVIDPTFRQFLIKDNCLPNRTIVYKLKGTINCTNNNDIEYITKMPTHPGYYLSLTKEGTLLGTQILNEGFFKLTEDNMKLYGDSFMKYNSQYISDYCLKSGEEYIEDIIITTPSSTMISNKEIYLTPKALRKRMCNNE